MGGQSLTLSEIARSVDFGGLEQDNRTFLLVDRISQIFLVQQGMGCSWSLAIPIFDSSFFSAGFRGRAPGQGIRGGRSPPKVEALFVFRRSMKAANLPTFLKFGNAKNQIFVLSLPKNNGWPRNWWGAEAKLGGCAFLSGSCLNPPLLRR